MQSLMSYYMKKDDGEEIDKPNAFDHIFGKRVVKKIKDKNSHTSVVEKLSFLEFKDSVNWEPFGPARLAEFVSDLF